MVAGDILYRSDSGRVNSLRNKGLLGGGYAWIFMYSREQIYIVVLLSSSVLDAAVKCHKKFLPFLKLLAL